MKISPSLISSSPRLAAPGRPDQHHEVAVVDSEVERVDRQGPVGVALGDVDEPDS